MTDKELEDLTIDWFRWSAGYGGPMRHRDAVKVFDALLAERAALRKALADAVAIAREFDARQQKAEAQVEAARALCRNQLDHGKVEADDLAGRILDVVGEALK